MYKRIVARSIDELLTFCLKNNFVKFDSKETGSEILVEIQGNFKKSEDSDDKHKEGMTPFVSSAFHDKINLNKSKIETDVFTENLPSSHLRPILANIVKNEENDELDFGSHDFYIEETTELDEDGNEIKVKKYVYEEQPIGVIDGTKNSIAYDKDADVNRAILHGYIYNEYCQDAIDILNRRGTVSCSVELSIRSMSFDANDMVLVLDDFYVSALTLLGENVSPGMQGSNLKIEDFSAKNESVKFDKDEKLIELLETLNNTLSNFNNKEQTLVQKNSEEGGDVKGMFEKLLEKYEKTLEDITFEYEGLSDEELEQKFAELFEEKEPETSEPEKFENLVRTYEISHEDLRYALYNLLDAYEEADDDYYYICNVFDDYFVYESWCTDKIYRQNYEKDNDSDTVTFNGERIELFRELLTASEKAELESMRSNYASLKEFKENVEKNELREKKEEVINSAKYEVLSAKDEKGEYINEDFAKLVKEIDNYSLSELETKIKVMHSDYVAEHSDFSLIKDEKPEPVKLFTNINGRAKPKKRYGDLFE